MIRLAVIACWISFIGAIGITILRFTGLAGVDTRSELYVLADSPLFVFVVLPVIFRMLRISKAEPQGVSSNAPGGTSTHESVPPSTTKRRGGL